MNGFCLNNWRHCYFAFCPEGCWVQHVYQAIEETSSFLDKYITDSPPGVVSNVVDLPWKMELLYEISTCCCNYTHRCVDTKISPTFGPTLRVGEANEHGSIECKFSANWLAEGRTGYGWIKRKHEMIGDPAFVLMSPVKWSEVRIALVQSKKHTINKTICTWENTKKRGFSG